MAMISLYGQYIKEREGFEIVENEHGFATYKITNNECYVRDVFVKPQHRQANIASTFVDRITKIAKDNGCSVVTTTVDSRAAGSTESAIAILKYGFKLLKTTNELIIFFREI